MPNFNLLGGIQIIFTLCLLPRQFVTLKTLDRIISVLFYGD